MADPPTPEQRQKWHEAGMDELSDETPLFRAAPFHVIGAGNSRIRRASLV